MLSKEVITFGQKNIIYCDGKCEKAWGINNRPKIQLDKNNEDDYVFLADSELEIAPVNPGTYEGDCGKPSFATERLNKWCYRECERCNRVITSNSDFSERVYNIKRFTI